jgi:hypothetical protein
MVLCAGNVEFSLVHLGVVVLSNIINFELVNTGEQCEDGLIQLHPGHDFLGVKIDVLPCLWCYLPFVNLLP